MSRYDIDQLHDGWAVIDLTTGKPAELDGEPQRGMLIEDASDLADEMNATEAAAISTRPADYGPAVNTGSRSEPRDVVLNALRELLDESRPQQEAPPKRG